MNDTWQQKVTIVGPHQKQIDNLLGTNNHWEGEATFTAEPNNPHDPNAVVVKVGRTIIGRLKATQTKHFHATGQKRITTPIAIVRTHSGSHLTHIGPGPVPASKQQIKWTNTLLDRIATTGGTVTTTDRTRIDGMGYLAASDWIEQIPARRW